MVREWWWRRGVCGGWRRVAVLAAWCALCVLVAPHLRATPSSSSSHSAPRPPQRALLRAATSPPPASSLAPSSPPPSPDALSEDELRAEAARRMPSLPLDFWHRHKDDKDRHYKKKECAPLPSIYELQFSDTYWQSVRSNVGTFHVWGAYMDKRNASRLGAAVRLLLVHDRLKPPPMHCQLWFEERPAPVIVRTLEYKYVWNPKWGNFRDGVWQPYLAACVLPAEVRDLVPAAVSLVERPCDRAATLLRVHYDAPATSPDQPDHEVGVCVKGLDFLHEDLSLRLVEWLELVLLLGASRVHLYRLQVHPNVERVLRYYETRGLATVTPLTLPGGAPNLPALQHMYLKKKTTHKRQMELIPYNDCLYRNMYRYRRLALLDVDEVIVPLQDADWPSLLSRAAVAAAAASPRPRSSYHASNLYYLESLQAERGGGPEPGVPSYMHMLSHVWRTANFTKPGQYVKAFHETGRVLTLHNHFPLACLGGACSSWPLPVEQARLQHYRADCVSALSKSCAELRRDPVRDDALWRWRKPLERRVAAALQELDLLPPER